MKGEYIYSAFTGTRVNYILNYTASFHFNNPIHCLFRLFQKCFPEVDKYDLWNQLNLLILIGHYKHNRKPIKSDELLSICFTELKEGYLCIPNIFNIKLSGDKTTLYPFVDSTGNKSNDDSWINSIYVPFITFCDNYECPYDDLINQVKANNKITSSMIVKLDGVNKDEKKVDDTPKEKIKGLELIMCPKDESINYLKEFNRFIGDLVRENRKEESNEQTIYLIKLEREKKVKMVENPTYTQYVEQKALIEKAIEEQNKKDDEESEVDTDAQNTQNKKKPKKKRKNTFYKPDLSLDLWRLKVPEKEVTVEYTESKIVKKEVKKFKKPIDTLYLRERDHRRLHGMLKTYENKEEVLTEFGIPHKLGILASGLPGTGKSTTIQAIATYLKLDVYYLDLNGIKKNSELKQMFDYVQKEQTTKGMIVFEDIDAMTSIVHKRTDLRYESTNLVDMEEDDLSLSYLLNLLDGTLCSDENVFMMTTNHKEKLDPAIFRAGRVDFDIDFKLCDHYQIKNIFKRIIKSDIEEELLNDIKIDEHTPAEIIFHLVQYVYDKDIPQREMLEPFLMRKIDL